MNQLNLMYSAARGKTALLDAVQLGLHYIRGAHHARKALLVISDGGDNHAGGGTGHRAGAARELASLVADGYYAPED